MEVTPNSPHDFAASRECIREGRPIDPLDAHARALLVEFKMRYTGSNNGDIGFSGKEMEEALGCSNRPAHRAPLVA